MDFTELPDKLNERVELKDVEDAGKKMPTGILYDCNLYESNYFGGKYLETHSKYDIIKVPEYYRIQPDVLNFLPFIPVVDTPDHVLGDHILGRAFVGTLDLQKRAGMDYQRNLEVVVHEIGHFLMPYEILEERIHEWARYKTIEYKPQKKQRFKY